MGFWDDFRSTAVKLVNRNHPDTPPVTDSCRSPYDLSLAAVTKMGNAVVDGTQSQKEHSPNPDRREKINRILTNVGKFAVESAVNEPIKGVTAGMQVYKIMHEGLKDQPPSLSSNDEKKPDHMVGMEEMQANMEKMREEINDVKQQSMVSTECVEGSEPLKKISTEHIKGSDLPKTERKRVMIRSRL
ncbi:hypothetical protein L1049_019755 [Liquidambar formosana]|uniref:Uncharacterized protein n=1 Tax=Liquidambar formosana TaxID=63359 RepID=A0AAP0XAD0_LIQFO